jgi:hypothetical protein
MLVIFIPSALPFGNSSSEVSEKTLATAFSILFPWALPTSLMVFSLTFEILYHMKIKMPFIFHAKRFLGRMVISVLCAVMFSATITMLYTFLSPFVSVRDVLKIALPVGAVIFGIVILKFQKFFRKLESGWQKA